MLILNILSLSGYYSSTFWRSSDSCIEIHKTNSLSLNYSEEANIINTWTVNHHPLPFVIFWQQFSGSQEGKLQCLAGKWWTKVNCCSLHILVVFVSREPPPWCECGRHGRSHPTSGVWPASQPWTPDPGITATPSNGQRGRPPAGKSVPFGIVWSITAIIWYLFLKYCHGKCLTCKMRSEYLLF